MNVNRNTALIWCFNSRTDIFDHLIHLISSLSKLYPDGKIFSALMYRSNSVKDMKIDSRREYDDVKDFFDNDIKM
jgi:hypothetical protein